MIGFLIYNIIAAAKDPLATEPLLVALIFTLVGLICVALTTILSVRHMNKLSKPLEMLGVRSNSKLMVLYCFFWVSLTILNVAILYLTIRGTSVCNSISHKIIYNVLHTKELREKTTECYRIWLAESCIFVPIYLCMVGLDFLVIYAY